MANQQPNTDGRLHVGKVYAWDKFGELSWYRYTLKRLRRRYLYMPIWYVQHGDGRKETVYPKRPVMTFKHTDQLRTWRQERG